MSNFSCENIDFALSRISSKKTLKKWRLREKLKSRFQVQKSMPPCGFALRIRSGFDVSLKALKWSTFVSHSEESKTLPNPQKNPKQPFHFGQKVVQAHQNHRSAAKKWLFGFFWGKGFFDSSKKRKESVGPL